MIFGAVLAGWLAFGAANVFVSGAPSSGATSDAFGPFVVKSETAPPAGWVKLDEVPSPRTPITLRIALASASDSESTLESELEAVSDPSSPRWRQHLSKQAVEALIAPSAESVDIVDQYLTAHGVDTSSSKDDAEVTRSPAGDWVYVRTTVSVVEELLDTTYALYKHSSTGRTVLRTTHYSLPAQLDPHVDVIQPTDYFGNVGAQGSSVVWDDDAPAFGNGVKLNTAAAAAAPFNITLQQLKDLYGVTGYKAPAKKGSLLGVTGYLEQYANLADLKQFYQINLPAAVNTTLKVELVNGAINSQAINDTGVEANLDVQFAGGVSWPVKNIFYSTYGRGQNTQPNISYEDNGNEPYDIFIGYLLKKNDHELPQTLTTSYGEGETDVPLNYARKVCSLYAQLGARGVSALHSSGDGGVGNGDDTTACSTPNRFGALFPAGCPYVTAVGATVGIPEVAVGFSGGGFSDYFSRPAYQSAKVLPYIKHLGKTYKGLYNPAGRAFPDVAAQGQRFEIVYQGRTGHVSGTSASTPAFAGIVGLLNDALVSRGRRPLGFLNPWLYSLKSGLNDITSGSNPGCGTEGFNATKGWDPVTGNGTPHFPALLKALHL